MKFPKHIVLSAFISVAALAAGSTIAYADAGHGSHGSHDGHDGHGASVGIPGKASEVSRTINVDMTDTMRFTPAKIVVKKGETIKFVVKNSGKVRHEMVLGLMKELKEHAEQMRKHPEMEHDDPNQVQVDPGKTGEFIWKFANAGTFDFACLQPGHFEAGMAGKVAVK